MLIVINGGSATAEFLVGPMLEANHRIIIIDKDLEVIEHLSEVLPRQVALVHGDGCDSDVLRDAAVREADLFIALTNHDEVNLVACELAMLEFGVPRCISNIASPKNRRIFDEIGIEPVSSTELIARMVEEEAIIGDMHMVFSLREGDIIMVEMKLPNRMRHVDGILASDIPLPRGVRLIAVVRSDDVEMIDANTYLFPGESIVAATKSTAQEDLKNALRKL